MSTKKEKSRINKIKYLDKLEEYIIIAVNNGWKELDLQGKKKIKSIEIEDAELYWSNFGLKLYVKVYGTTISFNVAQSDILLSPYFAKSIMNKDRAAYKLAGSYVYEWQNYLSEMSKTNPEDRLEVFYEWTKYIENGYEDLE